MKISLPSYRVALGVVLGLVALGQQAGAQVPASPAGPRVPTSRLLRGSHKAAATQATAATTQANPRLDGELARITGQAVTASKNRGAMPSATELKAVSPGLYFAQGTAGPTVLVQVTAADVNTLLPALKAVGFEVRTALPELHLLEGMLPVSVLTATGSSGLDGLVPKGLLGVSGVFLPQNHVGAVTSQADYVLEAARARATQPKRVTGQGINVGVLSDSFNALGTAAADVASGDLPTVNVLNDITDATDEGRAMAQLVYDLAPGAGLVFSTAYNTPGTFAQHIRDLANPAKGNCQVIVDDIFYFNEPYFQDGLIAQAVTDVVTNRGVAYFSAAGNNGSDSYENTNPQFVAGPNNRGRYLNFDVTGATTSINQAVTIPDGETFQPFLQWSDPFYTSGGVKTDLDMYLLALKGTTVDTVYRSTARNILTSNPLESVSYTNSSSTSGTTSFALVIRLRSGAVPSILKYIDFGSGGATVTTYTTNSSTLVGHAAAAEASAVAAVPYYNQRVAESYTSRGGAIPFLFSPTGAALPSGTTRQKPDIASVDGTNTTFFGGNDADGDGFENFFGTSAAAPHAAAVAALLRSSEPSLTPAQVYSRLVGSARLLGTSVTDPFTGPGLIDAFTALYGPVAAVAPPVAEDLEKEALPTSWLVYGTGAARAQVTSQAPASGRESLILDAYPTITSTSISSLSEATLYLRNAASTNLSLRFRQLKFVAETDEQMPTQFTNHSNTDGVALSVDGGTTWYRIADLTGTNATTSFQTQTINLSQFATANSLTLGNDVRVRFQRYGRRGSTATLPANRAGRAFDDIAVSNVVSPAPVPLYAYTPQPATGCPGLQVQYTDTSYYRPTAWQWTFAGGTPATSTARNPLVTYNTPGHYPVTLSVTNAGGTVTRTDTGVVFIQGRAPVVTTAPTDASICTGGTVSFTSTVASCGTTTYAWSFPGGTPATSSAQNPVVTYATAGSYTATLVVSNAYGSVTRTIPVDVGGRAIPYSENFDGATTLPRGWVLTTPSTYAWALVTNIINRSGTASNVIRAPFARDSNVGEYPTISTPVLNLAGAASPKLRFDLSYAPYSQVAGAVPTDIDSLIIRVADGCTGAILGSVYGKGAQGSLATHASQPTDYFPTSGADWRQELVDLTPYAGRSVVLQFRGRNGYGNNLYIDNVLVGDNVLSLTSAAATVGLEAWPNPTPSGTTLNLRLPAFSGQVGLRLLDALGRVVWQQQLTQTGAALERTLTLPFAPGLYNLVYTPAGGTPAARRIAIQ